MSTKQPMKITAQMLDRVAGSSAIPSKKTPKGFPLPELPPGVRGNDAMLAMDDASGYSILPWMLSQYVSGSQFKGYVYLAEQIQISEYRSPCETIATELTRHWIQFRSTGDADVSDKLEQIEAEFKRLDVRECFRRAAFQDQAFGRSQIYFDIKGQTDGDKRKQPLIVSPQTIAKGSLRGLTVIEPYWTTPFGYESLDPTSKYFYKPSQWYVVGHITHASRLMTFISREVPDLLKPTYNFGGISLTQLMEPYVNQWFRTRNSVSDLLHAFSVSVLSTDMAATLADGSASNLDNRIRMFTENRDNRGLTILNKDTEELIQINTPLSGLSELQAQAQEHMSAPSHIPLVKLFGVTPSGLNASSQDEIQVFYDHIRAMQENTFSPHLDTLLDIVQLSLFGAIDPSITYEYVPLTQLDGEALARVRKSDAEAGISYINAGVVAPEEERERLQSDPDSGYSNLEGPAPEPPEQPDVPGGASGGGESDSGGSDE